MAPYIVSALVAVVVLKPQEFVPFLKGFPLVYLLFGASLVAIFFDVVWRRVRPALAPQLVFAIGFLLWGTLTTALKRPDAVATKGVELAIIAGVLVAVWLGYSSQHGLRVFAVTFGLCAVCVTGVAIQQGFAPYGCFLAAPEDWEGKGELEHDGRACETVLDCRKDAPEPNGNYRCERVGPWKTASIGGRVRYRGSLADPNELALMVGMSLPLVFAFAGEVENRRRRKREARAGLEAERIGNEGQVALPRRPTSTQLPWMLTDSFIARMAGWLRRIPIWAITAAILLAVVLTKSRGGVVVIAVVLGAHFVRRAGAWGLVAGFAAGPPLLVFGGKRGDEDESSGERVELLREAFEMVRQTKGIGVGAGQFWDESSLGLTAHNSYILALAETGVVGMFLFAFLLYLSAKVPFAIWFGDFELSPTVRLMAPAIAVSLLGAYAGIFFLSWSYKDILYMALGASAALYGAARADDPRVRVSLTGREAMMVSAATIGLVGATFVLTRIAG